MGLFIDYVAAKKVIAPALKSLVGGGSTQSPAAGGLPAPGDGAV